MQKLAAVVVAALMAVACSDDGAKPTGQESAPDTPSTVAATLFEEGDFYAVPDPLPGGEPGTLIRYQPIADFAPGGATAYRILYLSRSAREEPVAVTGTVLIPTAAAPADGRRLVTVAHGTTGVADSCAPSKQPRLTELSLLAPAIEQGAVVVMSDYEGLGTPGIHPYLVAASEAHSVLDAARAARHVPGADVGERFAIAGYSQGGHGALAASSFAEEYVPELELVGTFAGAPPSEMETILGAGRGIPQAAGFVLMMIAGTHQAYPEADPALVLTQQGVDMLGQVEDGCVGDVLNRFGAVPGDQLFKADPVPVEPWRSLLRLSDLGQTKIDSPILIIHSKVDPVVPAALSEVIFNRMCGLGQVVERRLYEEGDHGAAAIRSIPEAMAWIVERFDGKPAASTCPTP